MPIDAYWDDEEKTLIYIQFMGDWTWDEYDATVDQIAEMISTITHRFDQLLDFRESGTVPAGDTRPHIGRGISKTPSNFGNSVMVGAPRVIRAIVAVLNLTVKKLDSTRLFAETLEEGYAILKALRQAGSKSAEDRI